MDTLSMIVEIEELAGGQLLAVAKLEHNVLGLQSKPRQAAAALVSLGLDIGAAFRLVVPERTPEIAIRVKNRTLAPHLFEYLKQECSSLFGEIEQKYPVSWVLQPNGIDGYCDLYDPDTVIEVLLQTVSCPACDASGQTGGCWECDAPAGSGHYHDCYFAGDAGVVQGATCTRCKGAGKIPAFMAGAK